MYRLGGRYTIQEAPDSTVCVKLFDGCRQPVELLLDVLVCQVSRLRPLRGLKCLSRRRLTPWAVRGLASR